MVLFEHSVTTLTFKMSGIIIHYDNLQQNFDNLKLWYQVIWKLN